MSFFVAFDAEGVLGLRSVVPLSSPSSALQLEMEGHAVFVSGDGGGGGSVLSPPPKQSQAADMLLKQPPPPQFGRIDDMRRRGVDWEGLGGE